MSESAGDLSPEQRRERIAAILALAAIRLAEHRRRIAAENLPPTAATCLDSGPETSLTVPRG